MTRNIRKVVSIICAVAILMSLCVVSMVNTTSAFQANDSSIGSALLSDSERSTVEEEAPFEILEYNFKIDSTNEYWNPDHHFVFANSTEAYGNKSYVDADGAHLYVDNPHVANTSAEWRQKMYIYDEDSGGFLKLQNGNTYIFTMKYKVEDLKGSNPVIGIGRSKTTSEPIYSQELLYFNKAWAYHSKVNMTDTQVLTTTFVCDSSANGTYAAVIAGGGANTFLIESIQVIVVRDFDKIAFIDYEVGTGDPIEDGMFAAGAASSNLPTPTNSDPDRGFAGWFLDKNLTVPVGDTLAAGTYTVYAKWSSDFSYITFNNSGEIIKNQKIAKGTPLSNPTRPNNKMFFEGWYTDLAFTDKVTVVPEYDCTLYAKYNYTYIGFNNGGVSDKNHVNTEIVTDPDDPTNMVARLSTKKNGTCNMEFGLYDAVEASAYEMLKLNATYYIEFKIKVPAGTAKGLATLMTGEQSAYSPDCSKGSTGITHEWVSQVNGNGIDWVTISGYYTTGDSWYRERVNFSVQDQLYLTLGLSEVTENDSDGFIYIDDFFIGEFSEEVPEGAVGIFFETNSTKITPAFGYAGESFELPADPVLAGHEFVGWYSDSALLTPYTGTTFGKESMTLYAKWKVVPITYTFDDFITTATSGRYNVLNSDGNAYIQYNFKQSPSSGSAGAARLVINNGTQYQVTAGNKYSMKFKYKIDEVTEAGKFGAVTHEAWSTWTNSASQGSGVSYAQPTNGWQEMEYIFTATSKTATSNCLSLTITGDSVLYIDDVTINCLGGTTANIYGSTVIRFDTLSDVLVDPVSGNPGDKIVLPTPTRKGFKFAGWYTESGLINKFAEKTYGEEDVLLYASWTLGKFTESYEDFPRVSLMGVASAYELHNKDNSNIVFDKANVHSGSTSVFRDGTKAGTKGFTLCRDSAITLGKGEQYTITFYVKPTNVTDAAGVINLIQMSTNTAVSIPDSTDVITDVGSLKTGEWQKISYTFTANQQYIGITTTEGNDIYFDSFTVTLKGYTGTSTGDNAVSPIIVMLMVVLSAGAVIITGKKVFEK